MLSGCEDYYPSNAPRQTATNKAAVLTTVTTIQTTRPETYSEYISSLHEMESSLREEAEHTIGIGGMKADTAVSREITETAETMERVTAVPNEISEQAETAVTTVPQNAESEEQQTVTCAVITEQAVTSPIFDLSDIPSVPSDRVKADTALTDTP
ncbi:MAG: hypothetical protein ACI4I1_03500 [Oscillospiraceae bacterium]